MKEGNKVKLHTFNGSLSGSCEHESENYWKLINKTGHVIKNPSESTVYAGFSTEKRVMVCFDEDIKLLGLHCHNEVENSLWILESDLEIL